jgi:hypothetical protein
VWKTDRTNSSSALLRVLLRIQCKKIKMVQKPNFYELKHDVWRLSKSFPLKLVAVPTGYVGPQGEHCFFPRLQFLRGHARRGDPTTMAYVPDADNARRTVDER